MRARWFHLISAGVLALALGTTGCAAQDEGADQNEAVAAGELRTQLSDAALQGKLRGILSDVTFISEGDYPYVVIEGDAVTENRLTTKLVREKLAAVVQANSGDRRDIKPSSCRAERLSVSEAIAMGDAAEVPDRDADGYVEAHHDKQVGIALKTMRSQLKSVVGFTFGTDESGNQDGLGTVLFVYVGISKTTGKLIAIMTEAAYT
jgi:hypothetical protein